jgi:hypothetical protein
MKLKEFVNEVFGIILEVLYTESLKPLKYYLKYKREESYWKDKDIYNTRADNF